MIESRWLLLVGFCLPIGFWFLSLKKFLLFSLPLSSFAESGTVILGQQRDFIYILFFFFFFCHQVSELIFVHTIILISLVD